MRQSIRKLNVSVPSDVHVMLSMYAKMHGKTLSQTIEELVKKHLTTRSSQIDVVYEDGVKEYKEGKAKKIESLEKEYGEMKETIHI